MPRPCSEKLDTNVRTSASVATRARGRRAISSMISTLRFMLLSASSPITNGWLHTCSFRNSSTRAGADRAKCSIHTEVSTSTTSRAPPPAHRLRTRFGSAEPGEALRGCARDQRLEPGVDQRSLFPDLRELLRLLDQLVVEIQGRPHAY